MDVLKPLLQLSPRQLAGQVINFLLIVSSALAIWRGLAITLNTESPIVVVLSESMEPAFQRGDLLFLSMTREPVRVGDITVYKLKGKEVPIVHRVIEVHDEASTNKTLILTKGDNNPLDDRGLYNPGQFWIEPEDIVGRVAGHLPYMGMLTILLNDYPWLKFVMLGSIALSALLTRDES